jgi:hypothetical protein
MRRSVLPAIALALALTACTDSNAVSGADESAAAPATASPSAGPTGQGADIDGPGTQLNERGNIPKALGEMGAIRRSPDPGEPTVLMFTVDELDVDPPCDSGFEQQPKTGHYLLPERAGGVRPPAAGSGQRVRRVGRAGHAGHLRHPRLPAGRPAERLGMAVLIRRSNSTL